MRKFTRSPIYSIALISMDYHVHGGEHDVQRYYFYNNVCILLVSIWLLIIKHMYYIDEGTGTHYIIYV